MDVSDQAVCLNVGPGSVLSSNEADRGAALRRAKRATRFAFFMAGFALSCWAPLVPFAQARIQADAALLGTVLLCLGLGAVIGMPTAGTLAGRFGSRAVIISGAIGLVIVMPLLAVASGPIALGAALFLFGSCIGAVDVAANVHGTDVQNAAKVSLMSGFHGLYSVGALVGVASMTALLALGASIVLATIAAASVIALCIATAIPGFLITRSNEKLPLLVAPRGNVLIIGMLAMVTFLAEGAMLDWGAILLSQVKHVEVSLSGTGFAVFALAMTLSRFVGDRIVARVGERRTLIVGLMLSAAGIAVAALVQPILLVLAGMALAGLAAGNVVPVLFTLAGRQKTMPASHAIAAASMLGYMGVLLGPALVGHVAHLLGLTTAFVAISAVLLFSMIATPALAGLTRK